MNRIYFKNAICVRNNYAFSLVELLVVVSTISILSALMLPALSQAKWRGQGAGCLNNLRQIGLANLLYTEDHGYYPPAWIDNETRWMDLLKPLVNKKSTVYLCPSDQKKMTVTWDSEIYLSYGMNVFRFGEKDSCFWYGVKANQVRRPSETIVFADCTPGKYYCGGGNVFTNPVVDVDYRHVKKVFTGAFCDGHAEIHSITQQNQWDVSK